MISHSSVYSIRIFHFAIIVVTYYFLMHFAIADPLILPASFTHPHFIRPMFYYLVTLADNLFYGRHIDFIAHSIPYPILLMNIFFFSLSRLCRLDRSSNPECSIVDGRQVHP